MAEGRRYALGAQLDIEQIISEAQHRWLRPAEICEILQNCQRFQISPEPPNQPLNGSLFLFDRKALRYFRKDGHNWRKKKDGKTVKEAHERLKAGSIDVLHCYYAHGEENENFQRRSYWMLEEERSHIVLVHYREVKGNRTNFSRIREAEEATTDIIERRDDIPNSEADSFASSKFQPHDYHVASQMTDTASLNSAQASEYEDAESAYSHQPSSGLHTFLELQPPSTQKMEERQSIPYYPVSVSNGYQGQCSAVPEMEFVSVTQKEKGQIITGRSGTYGSYGNLGLPSWGNVMESNPASLPANFQSSFSATQISNMNTVHGGNDMPGQVFNDVLGKGPDFGGHSDVLEKWQVPESDPLYASKWPLDQRVHIELVDNLANNLNNFSSLDLRNTLEPYNILSADESKSVVQNNVQPHLPDADGQNSLKPTPNCSSSAEGKADYPTFKQPLLDGVRKEGLKKLDSFDRWISKELGDVNESQIQSSSGTYWDTVGNENGIDDSSIAPSGHLDTYTMSPSLSQDQLFSIIDFSPNWGFSGSEIKVLITGRFLNAQQEVENCKWACMFGELEVPAEVIADGVLRCQTPSLEAGRVPFYVTCSNRLACSEVREFEFRVNIVEGENVTDVGSGGSDESHLLLRFAKLLTTGHCGYQNTIPSSSGTFAQLSRIDSLVKEDNYDWERILTLTSSKQFSIEKVKDQLLQKLLKDKLYLWLLQKVAEGGKGPSVLDEGGLGVLHFAAALGYDWAIPPTIAGGVSINFRDANGWTALHWAAIYGRERTVAFLISLDANPGALTDPTPKYPSGRTPADLASTNGHKGIAGYLAESSLSSHLSSLKLNDNIGGYNGDISGIKAVETISERCATPISCGDLPHGLSLKDSLAAVRNATQAAARIHQVFRVQSFQRKQIKEYGDSEFGMSDERALSLLAIKPNRVGHHDEPVTAAAIRIQNKFRCWKGRKEFLLTRQRIIKIQAHVRGHQVRKNYGKIIWSVGILDKVILRWRRKGSGLRGFRPEALAEGSSIQKRPPKEDDYDFLKEGRKQTEARLQKALARVKSMVQYPEARDQYRRLLNVVSEMQETKGVYDRVLNNPDDAADIDDNLIDLDALLEDDIAMAITS